jgi:alpha-ketoglutaric semialdehyde dehydrogenase
MVRTPLLHTWRSPLDGTDVASVDVTEPSEVPRVVARAREAFTSWSATTLESRGRIIRRAAQILESRAEDLARIVRRETGKPLGGALGEVSAAIEMGYLVASHGRHESGQLLPSAVPGRQVRVQRMPRGVAALIVTYNAPLPNFAWKVFPALMAGNTAILKPSPANPMSAEAFVEILREAGVPDDVLLVVHGQGDTAAAIIDSGVELVSFTGSYPTGQKVVEASARTMAKTIIELGGANPIIVCADTDLDRAVDVVLDSAFSNAGQRCSSGSRIIIDEAIYESFRERLLAKAKTVTWGTEDDVVVSTLIDQSSVDHFESFLRDASDSGALVQRVGTLVGKPHKDACLAQPAVVENLPIDHPLGMTEFFGPATRLFRCTGDDEAIAMANTSEYGLTAAVWTSNISRAESIVSKLQAGVININGPTHGAEVNMPFGGVKHSGNGSRDAGIHAIDQYSDVQVVSTFFGS